MPTLEDWQINAAFKKHLKTDEHVSHAAYGFFRPTRLKIVMVVGALVALVLASLVNLPIVRAGAGVFAFITWFIFFMGFFFMVLYFPVRHWARTYVIGLTDERLVVILLKTPIMGGKPDVSAALTVTDYPRRATLPVEVQAGRVFSLFTIRDPAQPFYAQFPNMLKGNTEQLNAIAASLRSAGA